MSVKEAKRGTKSQGERGCLRRQRDSESKSGVGWQKMIKEAEGRGQRRRR